MRIVAACIFFLYAGAANSADLVTVKVANGSNITIAGSVAARFQGFITDVVERGFKGPIHCFAKGGHVHRSNHYWGGACDFAQRGWGKTVGVMYHVADLARKWGLRDGCSFGDCGHIDASQERVIIAHVARPSKRAHRSGRALASVSFPTVPLLHRPL